MESLKNSKFKAFEESKISGLTNIIGGVTPIKTQDGSKNDLAIYTNKGGGTNNDSTVTATTDHFA